MGLPDVGVSWGGQPLELHSRGLLAWQHVWIVFFVRDVSCTWECDLDHDGKFELLRGHHQDKVKPGYHDMTKDKWINAVFRKYLFINAYSVGEQGLTLCNHLSDALPKVLCFKSTDPFDVLNYPGFLEFNQFKLPHDYAFRLERITGR